MKIYVWPDYSWMLAEEHEDAVHGFMGNDFCVVEVPDNIDPIDTFVELLECQDKLSWKAQGLKDHQIAELVNSIRDATAPMIPHQCLRTVIAKATNKYLEAKRLRIDKSNE